jgi:hypothetical protein
VQNAGMNEDARRAARAHVFDGVVVGMGERMGGVVVVRRRRGSRFFARERAASFVRWGRATAELSTVMLGGVQAAPCRTVNVCKLIEQAWWRSRSVCDAWCDDDYSFSRLGTPIERCAWQRLLPPPSAVQPRVPPSGLTVRRSFRRSIDVMGDMRRA